MSKMKAGDSCHKLGCGMCVFKSTICYTANKKSILISHIQHSAHTTEKQRNLDINSKVVGFF